MEQNIFDPVLTESDREILCSWRTATADTKLAASILFRDAYWKNRKNGIIIPCPDSIHYLYRYQLYIDSFLKVLGTLDKRPKMEEAQENPKIKCVDDLLNSGETWEVCYGWYEFGGNRPVCGWYLKKDGGLTVKPLQLPDLDDIYLIER